MCTTVHVYMYIHVYCRKCAYTYNNYHANTCCTCAVVHTLPTVNCTFTISVLHSLDSRNTCNSLTLYPTKTEMLYLMYMSSLLESSYSWSMHDRRYDK